MHPVILQIQQDASIKNFGGMALYGNELRKNLVAQVMGTSDADAINLGDILFQKYSNPFLEKLWALFLRFIKMLTRLHLTFLSKSFYYIIIQIVRLEFKSKNKKNVIYHHQNPFIFPNFAFFILAAKYNLRVVTTHHDFLDVDFPIYFKEADRLERFFIRKLLSSISSQFISIAKFVDYDAKRYLAIPERTSSNVIYHGVDHLKIIDHSHSGNSEFFDDFFLFPAKSWPHKGHEGFLEAFIRGAKDFDYNVILIGNLYSIKPLIKKLKAESNSLTFDRIKFYDYVGNELHTELFRRCKGVILPSVYEGFGFPYFEALLFEKIIFCFETKSQVEFFSNNPNFITSKILDFDDMIQNMNAHIMKNVIFQSNYNSELLSKLTWVNCARQTLNVYKLM